MGIGETIGELARAVGGLAQRVARLVDGVEDLDEVVLADRVVGLGGHLAHDRCAEDRREVVVRIVAHQHQARLFGVIPLCRGNLLREVLGNQDGVVVGTGLETGLGLLGGVDEVVFERPRIFERFDQIVSRMDLDAIFGGHGNILVDYGHGQRVEAAIGIVEGHEVERTVDKRNERDAEHRDLHAQVGTDGVEVEQRETQPAQRVLHARPPPLRGSCAPRRHAGRGHLRSGSRRYRSVLRDRSR